MKLLGSQIKKTNNNRGGNYQGRAQNNRNFNNRVAFQKPENGFNNNRGAYQKQENGMMSGARVGPRQH